MLESIQNLNPEQYSVYASALVAIGVFLHKVSESLKTRKEEKNLEERQEDFRRTLSEELRFYKDHYHKLMCEQSDLKADNARKEEQILYYQSLLSNIAKPEQLKLSSEQVEQAKIRYPRPSKA